MARGIARLNDSTFGTCYHPSHLTPLATGGKIVSASGKIIVNGRGAARIGDTVRSNCGHTGTIITGSGKDIGDNGGKPLARLNDKTTGHYKATITSASTDTFGDN